MANALGQIKFGDLATWIAAVGTVGVSVWLLVLQLRDRRAKRGAKRRQQAEQVAVWLAANEYDLDPPRLRIRASNRSDLPIYSVTVRVVAGIRGTFVRGVSAMGPKETREWTIILPGYPHSDYQPELMFTDVQGTVWIRTDSGALGEPNQDEQAAFMEGSPGAYASEADHPTLYPDPNNPAEYRGAKVTD